MIDLKVGSTISSGRFVISGKHGKGALGTEVFLGRDEKNNADVIIRVLPPALASDKESASRFKQSAELAKTLDHPNILPVLDAGEDDGILFLVTPNEKGFFLDDYLEHRGRLDEKESAKIIKSLADALNYAWNEKKVIHRNISPDTVYIAKGNVPKLTDFELAKSLEANNHLTMTGFTVGNPYYMSPEQARGETVDFRSDIYCLGLVFYQLLAGENPFADKSRPDALRAQITEKHPPVKSKNSDVSDACSRILDKMLEKDAERRCQSWRGVLTDIDAFLAGDAPSNSGSSSGEYKMKAVRIPEEPGEKRSSGYKKWLPAVVALLAIAALSVVLLGRGKNNGKSLPDKNPAEDASAAPADKPSPTAKPARTIDTAKPEKPSDKKPAITPAANETIKSNPSANLTDKETLDRKICAENVRKIAEALQMYSNVFDGAFPKPDGAAGLDTLIKKGFIEDPKVFICPGIGHVPTKKGAPLTDETCDYAYRGGLTDAAKDNPPILWIEPKASPDFGVVLYANGDIKTFSGKNWLKTAKVGLER